MKKTVKVLAALLASCILFGTFITGVFAADDDDITGKWEIGADYGETLYVDEGTNEAVYTLENFDNLAGKVTMVLAFYDANGKIIAVKSKTELTGLENVLTMPVDENVQSIKGFAVDAFTSVPLCDVMECIKTPD